MKKHLALGLASLLLLIAPSVSAHSIWLQEEGDQLSILYGGHGGETEGYDPTKVQTVSAYDLEGNLVSVDVNLGEDQVAIAPEGEVALVVVTFDNGFWVQTPEGWQNTSKRNVSEYTSSSHPLKYTKALYGWSEAIAQPVGLPLEIVPLTNPFELSQGDTLPVLVLLDGQPAANIEVVYAFNEEAPLTTDENGLVDVPLTETGLQHLEAGVRLSVEDNPDTDQIYHSSTLTFVLD